MILRRIAMVLFVPMMLAFGSGVYLYLGTLKSKVVKERAQVPTVTKPKFVLPGTVLVVQAGRLYKLNGGNFTEFGPAGDWMQPALTPDHTKIVAVSRGNQSSDLYLLDTKGNIAKRLTRNASGILDANHWAYYPRISLDGSSVLYSFDSPKAGYRVDFSIWTMPLNGTQSQARRRTDPYWYTGGDISPMPVSGTGLLYVKNSIDSTGVHSQIWYQSRSGAVGTPLTGPDDDCSQPALSPDGAQLAMVCTQGKQTARLEVAPFNGTILGPARVLLENAEYAMPTWSPDGKALIYYAPAGAAGHFQLWYVALPVAATPTASTAPSASASHAATVTAKPSAPAPIVPLQVTQGVDLTATSPPAWY